MSLRIVVAGVAVVIGSTALPVAAQSLPNVMAPKAAAQRAAASTNAHIAAEQADQSASSAQQGATPARQAAATRTTKSAPAAPATDGGTPEPAGKGKGAAKGATAAPAAAAAPTPPAGPGESSVAERGGRAEITLTREAFTYTTEGRRDPFLSLMRTGDLRPMVSDLRLVTIVYDPAGRSVAILRDLTTKEQYRVKVGQTLGRMRVAQIQPKSITFTVEAIGTVVQEVLAMNDTTRARSQ